MGESKPSYRNEAANAIAGAIRREGRTHRVSQARAAQLYFDTYAWEKQRIAEALDLDVATIDRLLAADGVVRCTECAFEFHRNCLGHLTLDDRGTLSVCMCGCDTACRV